MARITRQTARKLLANVKPEESFWINNGPIINNLKHLPKVIEKSDVRTFRHHVNKNKNDFSKWIAEVIGDKALATDLRKIRAKKAFLQRLKTRVNYLKKMAL